MNVEVREEDNDSVVEVPKDSWAELQLQNKDDENLSGKKRLKKVDDEELSENIDSKRAKVEDDVHP